MTYGLGSRTTGGHKLLDGPRDKWTQTNRRRDEQTSGQTDKQTDKFEMLKTACVVNWTVWKRLIFCHTCFWDKLALWYKDFDKLLRKGKSLSFDTSPEEQPYCIVGSVSLAFEIALNIQFSIKFGNTAQ